MLKYLIGLIPWGLKPCEKIINLSNILEILSLIPLIDINFIILPLSIPNFTKYLAWAIEVPIPETKYEISLSNFRLGTFNCWRYWLQRNVSLQ